MNNKFFFKLFIVYMTIFVVFSAIISSLVSNANVKFFRQRNEQLNIQELLLTQSRIDGQVAAALSYVDDLFSDPNIRSYYEYPMIDYYSLAQIRKKINAAATSFSTFNFKLAISKITDDIIVTTDGTEGFEKFLLREGIENSDELREFLVSTNDATAFVTTHTNDEGVECVTIAKHMITARHSPVVFVSFLKKYLLPKQDDKVLVIRGNGKIIAAAGDRDSQDLNEYAKTKSENEQRSSGVTVVSNGKQTEYTVSSNRMPWQIDIIADETRRPDFFEYFVMLMALVAISVPISSVLTRKMYTPVKRIMEFIQTNKNNEFESIIEFIRQQGLDKQILIEEVKENKKVMFDKFIRDMLLGLIDKESVSDLLKEYNLSWVHEGVIIVLIQSENELVILKDYIHEKFICVKWDADSYALVIGSQDMEVIRKIISKAFIELEEKQNICLSAVMSNVCKPSDFCTAMNNILQTKEYRLIGHKNNIISPCDPFDTQNKMYYSLDTQRTIVAKMTEDDHDKAISIFKNVLVENLINRNLTGEVLMQFIFRIITTIDLALQQINTTTERVYGEGAILFAELKTCKNQEEIMTKSIQMIEALARYIQCEGMNSEKDLSDKLLEFVHKNYHKDISRLDLAEHFNVSLNYIGQLFKRTTNENFNSYLQSYRVLKAKEYLTHSKLNIDEIATKTGYNSGHNFRRVFKKYEGVTPDEYRKMQDKGE